jgi:hypothetical protein
MKLLLTILACLVAASAGAQTIKSLGYNTTNGNIVAATNVTFTNSVGFATNARAATRTNLGGTTVGNSVFTATNAAAAATAIGLGATWLTNTDVTNFRTAIGLGGSSAVSFDALVIAPSSGDPLNVDSYQIEAPTYSFLFNWEERRLTQGSNNIFTWSSTDASFLVPATFATNVSVAGSLTVGSLATTTPSTWALDATQTAADTNGVLTLPSNANVIRLTNNNAISSVTNGVLGAFYYLVNQATNAVTISNVGGITIDGAQNLTLSPNESATLVATGPTNVSVANRGDLTDVALGGTANTAPSQTASSGSSLMTRDLGDARYGNIVFDELAADESITGTSDQNTPLSVVLAAGTYHYESVVNYTTASSTAGATILMPVNTGSDYAMGTTIEGAINNAPSMMRISQQAGPVSFVAIATASGISGQIRSGTASGTIKLAGASTLTMTAAQRDATDATNALVLKKGSFVLFRKTP